MSQIKQKSIKLNALLSAFNTLLTMAFSLITYPYVSRKLGAENFGMVNYAGSIVSYFLMLSQLGFSAYAIREGSKIRNNEKEYTLLCNQIFTMNFIMVIVASLALWLFCECTPFNKEFVGLIAVQSIVIITSWLGVNWVSIINEDYLFITIRTIILQLLLIGMVLVFIRHERDYILYATITVLANAGVSVLNFIHCNSINRLRFTYKVNIKKHVKPILVFFSNTVAVSIYLNSDITILGYYVGNATVGHYSVAVKVYSAIRTIIASVYHVSEARLSAYLGAGKWQEYKDLVNDLINIIIFFSIPITAILSLLSEEIVVLLAGKEYIIAGSYLKILSFALCFAILGAMFAYCIAVPLGQEKYVLTATIISAVENIVLNIVFVPVYGGVAASITTVLAEFTVVVYLIAKLRCEKDLVEYKMAIDNVIKCIISVIPLYFLRRIALFSELVLILRIISFAAAAFIVYCVMNYLSNNHYLKKVCKSYWMKKRIE